MLPLIKSMDLLEGHNFVISCNIYSGNGPFVFHWFKDDRPFDEHVHHKIDITENFSMLTLKNLSKIDAGTYKCQVNNAFGSDSSSSVINIKGLPIFSYYKYIHLNLISVLKCGAIVSNFQRYDTVVG